MIITKLLQTVIILSLLAIILILANTAASSAHQAVFTANLERGSDKAIVFEQPDIDRIFYANLTSPGQVDFYSFKANAGLSFKSKILIPRSSTNNKFRPAIALFGPGLPTPDTNELYSVPFNLPDGDGLVTSIADKSQENKTNDELYSNYDEPYTQAAFWEGQTLFRQLPQDGTYYLVVFNSSNQTGNYGLEVGDHDVTGLKETLSFPVQWLRIRLWFGDYLSPLLALVIILLLVVIAVGGRFWLGRKARSKRKKASLLGMPETAQKNKTGTIDLNQNFEKPVSEEPTPIEENIPLEVAKQEKTQTKLDENKEITNDKTYLKWRDGKLAGNLETDFIPAEETNPEIDDIETTNNKK